MMDFEEFEEEAYEGMRIKITQRKLQRDILKSEDLISVSFHFFIDKIKDQIERRNPKILSDIYKYYPCSSELKRTLVEDTLNYEWDLEPSDFLKLLEALEHIIETSAIYNHDLKWLDNLEPMAWIWTWVYLNYNPLGFKPAMPWVTLNCPEECLAYLKEEFFKNYETSRQAKINYLNNLKNVWNLVIRENLKAPFLSIKGEAKVKYTWNYLDKYNLLTNHYQALTESDVYRICFVSIYTTALHNPSNPQRIDKDILNPQRKIIKKIDKAWKQKGFREEANRKQSTLKIDRELHGLLKSLAKDKNISTRELLEELILNA